MKTVKEIINMNMGRGYKTPKIWAFIAVIFLTIFTGGLALFYKIYADLFKHGEY